MQRAMLPVLATGAFVMSFAAVAPASAQRGLMGGGLIEFLFSDQPQPPRSGRAPASSGPAGYPLYAVEQMPRPGYGPPDRVAAIDPEARRAAMDPRYRPQMTRYESSEPAGTIIIDTPNKFLYLVQGDGQAMRYGIGVGRPGFTWAGVKTVTAKREWPDWRPPEEMLKRKPDLPRYMPGGPENPLGARALYLGSSLYRIHGSNEPWTIGTAVSSGCIRMRNEDVTDLYQRVHVGTRVIVM
jgi:lipoprotein-anchoring transpeptidase ErfK/SrfK